MDWNGLDWIDVYEVDGDGWMMDGWIDRSLER